eukprot:sb/3475247/
MASFKLISKHFSEFRPNFGWYPRSQDDGSHMVRTFHIVLASEVRAEAQRHCESCAKLQKKNLKLKKSLGTFEDWTPTSPKFLFWNALATRARKFKTFVAMFEAMLAYMFVLDRTNYRIGASVYLDDLE